MSDFTHEAASKRDARSNRFLIRPMRKKDIPEVIKLRQEVKIHDASSCLQTWLTLDPYGIKVVENELGEIIGTCSAVKQNDDMYFVGLYYIREEYRGYGIGMQMRGWSGVGTRSSSSTVEKWSVNYVVWNICMERVTNAALNALPGKAELFHNKAGFTNVETEYRFYRNMTSYPVDPEGLSSNLPQGVTIEQFNKSHLPHVFAYDFALVGYKRERFLELSFQEKKTRTFVAFKNGVCVGFGSINTSCLGVGRVSPLYADESVVAEVLLRSLIISLPRVKGIAMMTVSTNVSAQRLLKKLNCPKTQEVTRLYKGKSMSINTNKLFGIFDGCFALF